MTEDEIEKADELHMEGKAVIGLVAFVLLIIGICWMSYESGVDKTDFRKIYLDGPVNAEVENIA
jgi:glucose uptake protein GlcU